MPPITILRNEALRYAARLDEMKLHVGVLLVLLTIVRMAIEKKEYVDMILVDHMYEMLGDMEGECESLRDALGVEQLPF